jgi:hypothetical protein
MQWGGSRNVKINKCIEDESNMDESSEHHIEFFRLLSVFIR